MATQKLISPIDGSVLVIRETASSKEIERVLTDAHTAREGWKATPLADRMALVEAYIKWFETNADEIGRELTQQMGRPIRYTPFEIHRGSGASAIYVFIGSAGPCGSSRGTEGWLHAIHPS
jgi:acyl-CoA reductase-like NAD-dependent aldehyde dehydrogenase